MLDLVHALFEKRRGPGWERATTGELLRICGSKRLIVYKHHFDGSYRYCIERGRHDFELPEYCDRRFPNEAAAVQACEEDAAVEALRPATLPAVTGVGRRVRANYSRR
jgi:hypothetical protein